MRQAALALALTGTGASLSTARDTTSYTTPPLAFIFPSGVTALSWRTAPELRVAQFARRATARQQPGDSGYSFAGAGHAWGGRRRRRRCRLKTAPAEPTSVALAAAEGVVGCEGDDSVGVQACEEGGQGEARMQEERHMRRLDVAVRCSISSASILTVNTRRIILVR